MTMSQVTEKLGGDCYWLILAEYQGLSVLDALPLPYISEHEGQAQRMWRELPKVLRDSRVPGQKPCEEIHTLKTKGHSHWRKSEPWV